MDLVIFAGYTRRDHLSLVDTPALCSRVIGLRGASKQAVSFDGSAGVEWMTEYNGVPE